MELGNSVLLQSGNNKANKANGDRGGQRKQGFRRVPSCRLSSLRVITTSEHQGFRGKEQLGLKLVFIARKLRDITGCDTAAHIQISSNSES